jgi:YVTN family beta-propeller protein
MVTLVIAVAIGLSGGASAATAAATPPTSFAYTANFFGKGVSVVDTSTNAVVATVPVGGFPRDVAINPSGSRAYVAATVSDAVSVIDTATNSVLATVPVGVSPSAVAVSPDGARAYVANLSSDNVSVIDTSSNTVATTISVGVGPTGLAITPDGKFAYVANQDDDSVSVVELATNAVVKTISVGDQPRDLAISPNGSLVYVSNWLDSSVSEISTATNAVTETIAVDWPGAVAFAPSGSLAYIADEQEPEPGPGGYAESVSIVDVAARAVTGSVSVGTFPQGVAVAPGGGRAYVANGNSNSVSVIDTTSNSVVGTVPVGTFPTDVAVTPPIERRLPEDQISVSGGGGGSVPGAGGPSQSTSRVACPARGFLYAAVPAGYVVTELRGSCVRVDLPRSGAIVCAYPFELPKVPDAYVITEVRSAKACGAAGAFRIALPTNGITVCGPKQRLTPSFPDAYVVTSIFESRDCGGANFSGRPRSPENAVRISLPKDGMTVCPRPGFEYPKVPDAYAITAVGRGGACGQYEGSSTRLRMSAEIRLPQEGMIVCGLLLYPKVPDGYVNKAQLYSPSCRADVVQSLGYNAVRIGRTPLAQRPELTSSTLTASPKGAVGVSLICPPVADSCSGKVSLRLPQRASAATSLMAIGGMGRDLRGIGAGGSFSLRGGQTGLVGLRLDGEMRRLLARRHAVRAMVTLRVNEVPLGKRTVHQVVTLRAARAVPSST